MKAENVRVKCGQWAQNNVVLFLFFLALTFALNSSYILPYFESPDALGLDGGGHFAAGELYSKHIFPKTSGWLHEWFLGLPLPNFYPPLFYFLVSVLDHLGLSYAFSYKLAVLLPCLSIPSALVLAANRLFHSTTALYGTGLFATLLLSSNISYLGLALPSTLSTGLVTEPLAFLFLVVALVFYAKVDTSRQARIISGVAAGLSALTSVHTIEVFALIALIELSFTIIKNSSPDDILYALQKRLVIVAVAAGLGAFWYLPLLTSLRFTGGQSFGFSITWQFVLTHAPALLAALFAIFISFRKKHALLFSLGSSVFITLALLVLNVHEQLPAIVVHFYRLFGIALFLTPLCLGVVVGAVVTWKRPLLNKRLLGATILALFLTVAHNLFFLQPKNRIGFERIFNTQSLDTITERISPASEVTLVEHDAVSPGTSYTLNAELGRDGRFSAFHILRESSISSIFLMPVRNSVSRSADSVGVFSTLTLDRDFMSAPIDERVGRLRFLGIQHTLGWTPQFARIMAGTTMKNFTAAPYRLYSFQEKIPRAAFLAHKPALLYAPLNFKRRSLGSYDFTRFQEEFLNFGAFDVVMVHGNTLLDTLVDNGNFGGLILTHYPYTSLERAFEAVRDFAKRHDVILVAAPENPLYRALAALPFPYRIYDFSRKKGVTQDELRTEIQAMFAILNEHKEETGAPVTPLSISFEQNTITVSSTAGKHSSADKRFPLLIKSTYSPLWSSTPSEMIYLASPSFILTFSSGDITLHFKSSPWLSIGAVLSVVTFLFVLTSLVDRNERKRNTLETRL